MSLSLNPPLSSMISITSAKPLFRAVETTYPDLRDDIARRFGPVTDQQRQFIYLAHLGLTNPQIHTLTAIPRATVWRWGKKYR